MSSWDQHANFAYSTVSTAPSPAVSGTSLTLNAGDGAKFPAPPFNITVWPANLPPIASNAEICRVTVVTGDVLTITRAQEGTSARTILVGYQVSNGITVKTFTDIENTVNQSRAVTATVAPVGVQADYNTDGTADDVQINAAIAAVNASGGGEVRLRSGTYNLAATISLLSNIVLSGEGYATLVKPLTGTSVAAVSTGTMGAIQIAAQSNVTIRNIRIDGTALTGPNGLAIFISESSDIDVHNCRLENINGFGVFTSAGFITPSGVSQRVRIHDNYIQGLGQNDLIGGGKHTTGSKVYDVKAYANTVIQDMSGGGVYGTAIDLTGTSGMTINSNLTYGSIILGVEQYPNLTTVISNNHIRHAIGSSNSCQINANTSSSAITNSSSLSITGNVFEESGTIVVRGVAGQLYSNIAISGNSVIGDGSTSTCQLVYVSGATISSNSFSTGVNGIQLSTSDHIEISGNIFASLTTGINDQTGVNTINIGHNTFNNVTTNIIGGNYNIVDTSTPQLIPGQKTFSSAPIFSSGFGFQVGINPIPSGTTISSVSPGVSAVISNNATQTGTAIIVIAGRVVRVTTITGSSTITLVTGSLLSTDVGSSVSNAALQFTQQLGTHGMAINIQSADQPTGTGNVILTLNPDVNSDPTSGIQSEIIWYNVTGRNYERFLIANVGNQTTFAGMANGLGIPRPIVFAVGGSVALAIPAPNDFIIHGEGSIDLNGATFTTGTATLDSGVFTKPASTYATLSSISAGVSAVSSIIANTTGTINAWIQPSAGAGRVLSGVGTTSGSTAVTGNFLATDSGARIWSLPTISSIVASNRSVTDGVINTTTTITSATANFVAGDQYAAVYGSGVPLGAYITTVVNSTTATLNLPATASASGVSITLGPSWVLNTAVATVGGDWPAGAQGVMDITIVGSAGNPVKTQTTLQANSIVVVPKPGATGNQLPDPGDVGAIAYSQKTFGNTTTRVFDPNNTGRSTFIIDTMTTTSSLSTTSDQAAVRYRRGGSNKWLVGLNSSGAGLDSFDVYSSGSSIAAISFTPNGNTKLGAGLQVDRTAVSDTNYSILATDYIIAYTSLSTPRTTTLPTAVGATGQEHVIKDESGAAAAHNITIATTSTQTIDGIATQSISSNYGVLRVYSNGTNWFTR